MATILSLSPDNGNNIAHVSSNGSEVTFRVSTEITFEPGHKYIQTAYTVVNNNDYPTNVPELHIQITKDAQGEEALKVSELVDVSMSDIFEPVSILVMIKEHGDLRIEQVYIEQAQSMHRGGIGDIDSYTRPLDSRILPTDIGPPGFSDDSADDDLSKDGFEALEDIGPPE